jgi:predicted CXXCH cytochrome family protein
LTGDHPFAFVPAVTNPQIKNPPPGDPVRLDGQGKMQCRTCHDPHDEKIDPVEGRFLVKKNSGSAICTTCHNPMGGVGSNVWSWDGTHGSPSSHAIAGNTYNNGTSGNVPNLGSHTGYTTVATNGCESCHRPHASQTASYILKGETDQVCFQCHDGNPVTGLRDLKSEFTTKRYVHPSLGPVPEHDAAEPPGNIVLRHAACVDCHNPHASRANTGTLTPPQLSSALLGQSGIAGNGIPRDPRRGTGEALYEYEICLKCHSYNPNQPQLSGYQAYGAMPSRQAPSANLQQAFNSPAGTHAVIRPGGLSTGPGGEVPSLLAAPVDLSGTPLPGRTLSASSQLFCSDCHNNDTGRNLGPSHAGPAGIHGSNYIHLLERSYLIETPTGSAGNTPGVPYSGFNYALCYKCHDERSILSDASFKGHSRHTQFASCATCHDPHGVPNGHSANNAALINFDLSIVAPNNAGALIFNRTSVGHGSCSLRCHGQDHNNAGY